MGLTEEKTRDGWQRQAERLAVSHTSVATKVVTATEQVRRRPLLRAVSSGSSPAAEARTGRGPASAEFADPDQQAAREAAADWIVNARRQTLAARAARDASTDKRIADLEGELALARERIAFLENETHSLQSSLDLTARENARLSVCLKESNAVGYRARSQLEQTTAALASKEAERDRMASAGRRSSCQIGAGAGGAGRDGGRTRQARFRSQ